MSTPDTDYFTTYSGGWHNSLAFKYVNTDANGCYVCAAHVISTGALNDGTGNKIKFDPSTGVWSDVNTSAPPAQFTSSSTWANTTSVGGYPTKLWVWNGSTNLNLEMDTPSWAQSGSSGGSSGQTGPGPQTPVVDPEVTGITFTKTNHYELTVSFTYNHIRVSPNSPTTDVEYMVIKNITDGTIVWSEHVSSAVTQPAYRNIVLDVLPTGTYANKFGHGDQLQIMHTDHNGDATDYDETIIYDQNRVYSYVASGPFDVSYKKVPGYALYNLQVRDLNPFPDNGTRVKVKDLDGNDVSDNQGNVIGAGQLHDLSTNSTPAYYLSCGLNKSDVKPFVKLYLQHFYSNTNGSYTGDVFHSNLKPSSKVSSNFW